MTWAGIEGRCKPFACHRPCQISRLHYLIIFLTNQREALSGNKMDLVQSSSGVTFRQIQPWHIVLGDTHAALKTTLATKIVREEKERCKALHRGKGTEYWTPLAEKAWQERLLQEFPTVNENERGRILIKCTDKTTDRVLVPNVYGYEGDDLPMYGIAKKDAAMSFFLDSRDAPTLKKEIDRYVKQLEEKFGISKSTSSSAKMKGSMAMANGFFKILSFYHETLEEASNGDEFAKEVLELHKPIPKLNKLWKKLMKSTDESTSPATRDGFGCLLQNRLQLFQTIHGGSQMASVRQLPAEKVVSFDSTLNLMEMKLKANAVGACKAEESVICSPESTLEELKTKLDNQWKLLRQPQDSTTCTTAEETMSDDGMSSLQDQQLEINEDPRSPWVPRRPASPHVAWNIPGFNNDTASKRFPDADTAYESDEGSMLFQSVFSESPQTSPCSKAYREGFSESFASMNNSEVELLQNILRQGPYNEEPQNRPCRLGSSGHSCDLSFARMSISGHSKLSLGEFSMSSHSKTYMDGFAMGDGSSHRMEFPGLVSSSHSPSTPDESMQVDAPRSSSTMEKMMQKKHGLSKNRSRQCVTEAMTQLGLEAGVLYSKALEARCLELAEERGWLVDGKPPIKLPRIGTLGWTWRHPVSLQPT